MSGYMQYIAKHTETGNVVTGSAKEIAGVIGCLPTSISSTCSNRGTIRGYRVKKADVETLDFEDRDRIVAPFRKVEWVRHKGRGIKVLDGKGEK